MTINWNQYEQMMKLDIKAHDVDCYLGKPQSSGATRDNPTYGLYLNNKEWLKMGKKDELMFEGTYTEIEAFLGGLIVQRAYLREIGVLTDERMAEAKEKAQQEEVIKILKSKGENEPEDNDKMPNILTGIRSRRAKTKPTAQDLVVFYRKRREAEEKKKREEKYKDVKADYDDHSPLDDPTSYF